MKSYSIKSDIWQSFCVLILITALPLCFLANFLLLKNNFTRWSFIIGYAIWAIIDRPKEKIKLWWCREEELEEFGLVREGIKGYFEGAEIKFVDADAFKEKRGEPMIFGCHPHGIFGLSPLINTALCNKIDELLGCPIHVLTLSISF